MKIGLVICGDLDFPSGGFLYDRRLVHTLRAAGDEVEIISLPWDAYGFRLARGRDPRLRARLAGWRGDLLLQDELAHPSLAPANRALRRAGSMPIVSIVHHLRASEAQGAFSAAVARAAERAYLRSVDAFVFNGRATRQTVEALIGAGAPGIVAPPGGDRLGPRVTEQHAAARAREPGALRILFLGNLIPRKGLLLLLRALDSLPRGGWSLTIAGSPSADPAHAERVREFVREHDLQGFVHFAGHVPDDQLALHLAASHVLAIPSEYEGFGIAYLEAMGFGVVPIGSSAGGAGDVIEDGKSGFLVSPGDWETLAGVLRRLGDDRPLLQARSRDALRRHHELPGWEQSMRKVRDWLGCMVSGTVVLGEPRAAARPAGAQGVGSR